MVTIQKNREGRPVSFSAIESQRIKLFDEHTNPHGFIFGNRILDIVDQYAKIVAEKHTDFQCLISGINHVRFFNQARREDVIICKASVNQIWKNSLEVGVKIIAEDFRTLEQKHILSAYFTFEAIDKESSNIISLIFENEDQIRRSKEADKRKIKTRKLPSISPTNN
jgi:acyl-CoA hydrolase